MHLRPWGTLLNTSYRRLPVLQLVQILIPRRGPVVPRSYLVLLCPSWRKLRPYNHPHCLQPLMITAFLIRVLHKFTIWFHRCTIKLKQSLYRPGQALRVPGGWGSQISRQSAHEGGKVVSPMNRLPFKPSKYSWVLSVCSWVDPVNEKFQWHHRGSKPRPYGMKRSASTNCATACPSLYIQRFPSGFQWGLHQ